MKKKLYYGIIILGMAATACSNDSGTEIEEIMTVEVSEVSDLTLRKGQTMTIVGVNFNPAIEENVVIFANARAEVTSATATEIQIIVPDDATSGLITVTTNGQTVTVGEFILLSDVETVFIEGGTYTKGLEGFTETATVESFGISKYEVTNAEFAEFLNDYGSDRILSDETDAGQVLVYENQGLINSNGLWSAVTNFERHPVSHVTWYGASKYAEWYGGRLPSDDEWEWAARGAGQSQGFEYAGSNDLAMVGWYDDNANSTNEVGISMPNEIGLFDMSGNVSEWTTDTNGFVDNGRIVRGGNWNLPELFSQVRYNLDEVARDSDDLDLLKGCGIRLVVD